MQMLGVDIGGSGIKGCLVDTATGELIGERHRLVTPQPATPAAVAHTLKALVEHFDWKGPVGCGFPATIHNGIAKSAANIDKSWYWLVTCSFTQINPKKNGLPVLPLR